MTNMAIGVIEHGALGFTFRHDNCFASAGSINLCIPGEVHSGHAVTDDGYSYRMLYLDPDFLRVISSEIAGYSRTIPYFKPGVIQDSSVAHQLRYAHLGLEQHGTMLRESEAWIFSSLACLIPRHADDPSSLSTVSKEPQAVASVKDYLQMCDAQDVSLDDLSRLTHLTRFHLLRIFEKTTGIPPRAYLGQVRLQRATILLADKTLGRSIADVAAATRFTDPSHLTK